MSAERGAITKGVWERKTVLPARTTSGTGDAIPCAGAKRITLIFTRADHSAGSSAFSVEVNIGGVWLTFNKLIKNLTNTNAQTKTRVASVSLAANGSEIVDMDLENTVVQEFRVAVAETTDGTHSADAVIEY